MPKIEMRISKEAQAEAAALLKIAKDRNMPVEEIIMLPNIRDLIAKETRT
jgi:hypothetical protein